MTFYTVRPYSTPWTNVTPIEQRRSRYTFKAPWTNTIDLLERELAHLDADGVIFEIDVDERDLRLDGGLRAHARPDFPGVRVRFDSRHGALVYETDVCDYWQHNVRSIALGLEALRAVDRYGISKRAEQYTGWKALPPGSGATASHMTTDEAWAVIESIVDFKFTASERADPLEKRAAYREAQRRAHPDRNGGRHEDWHRLEEAGRVLGVAR